MDIIPLPENYILYDDKALEKRYRNTGGYV